MAAMLESCVFINASPQNTVCPGLVKMATKYGGFIAGSDISTGQTRTKTALIEHFIASGIKPKSIFSANILGNTDGLNLLGERQFKSKEKSKSGVLDDSIQSNPILYPPLQDSIEHVVRIDYIKEIGDGKKAMDHYYCETMFNKYVDMHVSSTFPDTNLAVPMLFDLVIFSEWLTRLQHDDGTKLQTSSKLLKLFF